MKKTFISILAVLLSTPVMFAHDQVDQLPKKDYRNWSIMLKGGATRNGYAHFGDNAITSTDDGVFTGMYGVEIERTITQLWGMSLDANIYNFNGAFNAATPFSSDYNMYVQGEAIETALLGSLNLSNLLAPKRSEGWRKFNVYFRAGAGLTFYKTNQNGVSDQFVKDLNLDNGIFRGGVDYVAGTDRDQDFDKDYEKTSIVVPAELQAEYNFAKPLAIGLVVGYRWHSSDHFGFPNVPQSVVDDKVVLSGTPTSGSNIDFFTAQLSLRWKIRSTGDNNHIRNFTPELTQDVAFAKAYNDKPVLDRLDGIDGRLDDLDGRLSDVEQALRDHDAIMAGLKEGTTDFADPDLLIIPIVEFDVDSYKIRDNASADLDVLAEALSTEPNDFTLMISGHTDSTASDAHNETLSQNRANAVKEYLANKGVKQEMVATGFGERKPIASNNDAEGRQRNRHVEIRFAGR
jgi:outer membrane protein OmpA-like peptidoglycan-associated protein